MFHIAVLNEATSYTLPAGLVTPLGFGALPKQVGDHFAPEWGTFATVRLITGISQKLPGEWLLAVLDDSDQADALGYHELTSDGQPLGKVFARSTMEDGLNPTVTISHELLEMLADPDINLASQVSAAQFYAREVCDAPEDDKYGYEVQGILLSDFVHRSWFIPGASGPYDHMGYISKPLEVLSGGYIGVLDVQTSGWTQIDAEAAPSPPNSRSKPRFAKRNKPRSEWRYSRTYER